MTTTPAAFAVRARLAALFAALFAAAALACGSSAFAAQADGEIDDPEAAMSSEPDTPADFEQPLQIGDAELEQFAQAHAEVRAVRARYEERIAEADDPQERAELEIEATGAIAEAMQSTGLALEDYNHIYIHVTADPALEADLEQRVEAISD